MLKMCDQMDHTGGSGKDVLQSKLVWTEKNLEVLIQHPSLRLALRAMQTSVIVWSEICFDGWCGGGCQLLWCWDSKREYWIGSQVCGWSFRTFYYQQASSWNCHRFGWALACKMAAWIRRVPLMRGGSVQPWFFWRTERFFQSPKRQPWLNDKTKMRLTVFVERQKKEKIPVRRRDALLKGSQ